MISSVNFSDLPSQQIEHQMWKNRRLAADKSAEIVYCSHVNMEPSLSRKFAKSYGTEAASRAKGGTNYPVLVWRSSQRAWWMYNKVFWGYKKSFLMLWQKSSNPQQNIAKSPQNILLYFVSVHFAYLGQNCNRRIGLPAVMTLETLLIGC